MQKLDNTQENNNENGNTHETGNFSGFPDDALQ